MLRDADWQGQLFDLVGGKSRDYGVRILFFSKNSEAKFYWKRQIYKEIYIIWFEWCNVYEERLIFRI